MFNDGETYEHVSKKMDKIVINNIKRFAKFYTNILTKKWKYIPHQFWVQNQHILQFTQDQ